MPTKICIHLRQAAQLWLSQSADGRGGLHKPPGSLAAIAHPGSVIPTPSDALAAPSPCWPFLHTN